MPFYKNYSAIIFRQVITLSSFSAGGKTFLYLFFIERSILFITIYKWCAARDRLTGLPDTMSIKNNICIAIDRGNLTK